MPWDANVASLKKIRDNGADYLLAVKSNQDNLYELIRTCFNEAKYKEF